ncbi:hypothetical protein Dimus_025106 [Dionaea muscipula]
MSALERARGVAAAEKSKGAATLCGNVQESGVGDVSRAASEGDFALRGGETEFQPVSDYFFDVDSVVFWGILCKGMIFFMFWAVAICGDLCCSYEASTGSVVASCARLSPPGMDRSVVIWQAAFNLLVGHTILQCGAAYKDIFSKPDDILTAAEKHIQEHGIDDSRMSLTREGEERFVSREKE